VHGAEGEEKLKANTGSRLKAERKGKDRKDEKRGKMDEKSAIN
jgi:hypothetical protein